MTKTVAKAKPVTLMLYEVTVSYRSILSLDGIRETTYIAVRDDLELLPIIRRLQEIVWEKLGGSTSVSISKQYKGIVHQLQV